VLSAQRAADEFVPDSQMIFVDGVEEVDPEGRVIRKSRPAKKREKKNELEAIEDKIQATF
jgi:hypothetical protein